MNALQDPVSISATNNEAWKEAQVYERQTWYINNKRNGYSKLLYKFIKAFRHPKQLYYMLKYADFYCGNDWNYWWMEQFEGYKVLPKSIESSLEIGCGPYSNTRLISKLITIKKIYCSDPLMDVYKTFTLTWISEMARKGKITTMNGKGEHVDLPDGSMNLVICINVLDHVEDAGKCLSEAYRVLAPGGCMVLGQDLTDEVDLARIPNSEGHPIRLSEQWLDSGFAPQYKSLLKKVLPRDAGRNPEGHCGTYLFIGQK